MDTTTFKAKIYEPYLEAWKILKLIQYADQTSDSDEQWQRYMREIDRLQKTYPDNKFVEQLITLLLNAGDIIAKENRKQ